MEARALLNDRSAIRTHATVTHQLSIPTPTLLVFILSSVGKMGDITHICLHVDPGRNVDTFISPRQVDGKWQTLGKGTVDYDQQTAYNNLP